jgi:acetyl esterase/lipase
VTRAASGLAQPDGFVVDDVAVGATDAGYLDPEFLSEVDRMVFQTSANGVQQVWIAELNPLTGLLVSATGKDLLVDTDVAAIGPQFDTTNGPEWGLDSEGAAVFYSKRDTNGVVQCWRASNLVAGGVKAAPLTNLSGPDGEGAIMVIARKDASRPTTQFIYRYLPAPRFQEDGPARWADETAPNAVHDIPQFNGAAAAPSWIEGTEDFAYAMLVAPGRSEIARFSTATGTATVLTSHTGAKYNVHAFKAPELNGELLVGCVIDRTRFTVFRSDGTRYAPWADLVPPDPERPYMISPEIFQAGGMTYFAVQMCSHSPGSLGVLPQNVDCSMWILGLGKDASQRVARRVDEGAVSGARAYRFEPEVYVGANEVFLFYSIGNTPHRARTGINVADVEAVYGRLRARGTEIAVPPATYGDAARVIENVRYAATPGVDPDLQSLDLYLPQEPDGRARPILAFVHGGGWQDGDKDAILRSGMVEAGLREGYLVASVNYRLAPAAAFPAHAEDVGAAAAWLHAHAAELGGDPAGLVLIGHSAGAHLVALVGTDERYLATRGLAPCALRAVVPLDTQTYDIPRLAARLGGWLPGLYGEVFGQEPAFWAFASPVTYVGPGRGIPPMAVAFSGGQAPYGNSDRAADALHFVTRLQAAGVPAEIVPAPEKTHAQIATEFGLAGDHVAEAVFAFLTRLPWPADARRNGGAGP